MAIVYRTAGPWGGGQGFNLSNVQVDTNFYTLQTQMDDLVATPPTAVGIASIEVIGDQMYVHLTDSSVQGPFTLPSTVYNPRGNWQPNTAYFANDLVSNGGTLYVVLADHTSAATFDPGANNGAGQDFYKVFFTSPSNALPTGGQTRQVLTKTTNADYAVAWTTGLVINGGTTGQVLAKGSGTDQDLVWTTPVTNTPTGLTIKTVSGAASNYTLVLTDAFNYIRFTDAVGGSITVPTNLSVAFPVGTEITFRQVGTGSGGWFFNPVSGVTINTPTGFLRTLLGLHATATLKKVNTNEWDLFGLLLPA